MIKQVVILLHLSYKLLLFVAHNLNALLLILIFVKVKEQIINHIHHFYTVRLSFVESHIHMMT